MTLSYINIEEVNMDKLNYALLAAVDAASIKQAMQKEPKLKSDVMQLKVKGGVTATLLDKLAAGMEHYFQFYTTLGNLFIDKYSKKYEPLAKQFVELSFADYEVFLQQHMNSKEEYARFVTMIRFLKQASRYSEPLQYILQSTEITTKEVQRMDNKQLQQKKRQITTLLDELFQAIDDEGELKVAKEENEAHAKKIKTLEKKIATQQTELETARANVQTEKKKLKDSLDKIESLDVEMLKLFDELKDITLQANDAKSQYNQLNSKTKDYKTELVTLKNKYEKQLRDQDNQAAMEKQVVQAQLDSSKNELEKANKKNEKLQLKLEQLQKENDDLLLQLKTMQQATVSNESTTATVIEAMAAIEELQPAMQKSAVAVEEHDDIQQANSERLKAMGFAITQSENLFDDDDDLFDLDENMPQFD